jgi:hypothetical protein
MTKKNRFKKIFEKTAIEPADTQTRSEQSPQMQEGEATPPAANLQGKSQPIASSDEESIEEPSGPSEDRKAEITESVQIEQQGESIATAANADEVNQPTNHIEESVSQSVPSDERKAEIAESISVETENETTPSEPNRLEERLDATSEAEGSPTSANDEETSPDDLLEDVRQSLIEEELDEDKKETKWWQRIGRKRKSAKAEQTVPNAEIDFPAMPVPMDLGEGPQPTKDADAYTEQIDDLIDLLEAEHQESAVESSTIAPEAETPAEPEPQIDFEELKEQAFRPRSAEEESETATDVRSIALEDGEEVFVEVEARAPDTVDERLKAFENALRPYRRYIYLTLAFLGVVMAAIASLLIFNAYQQSKPEPAREVSNLPYPTAVSLPGGWTFGLGRGSLQDGKWEPQGAEWLEGTEVCRWVSLPWSRQLEAVVRTLNPKDPIELVMSNNDKLTYQVYSVYEMTLQEIQALDSNSPCLLIILTPSDTQSESGKRWVLTALP